MIKQSGTGGYVSISGGRIAAIVLVSICSFALATPHHQSNKGGKAHAKHNHSAQHKQGAKRSQGGQDAVSQAQHSVGAGHRGKAKHALLPQLDATATPTPEENSSPTPDTRLGSSAMATPTPSP